MTVTVSVVVVVLLDSSKNQRRNYGGENGIDPPLIFSIKSMKYELMSNG